MAATILVIDDNLDMQFLFRRFLEIWGYDVVVAINGEDGLRELEQSHPDLVLLDLMMPVMDGFEFLEVKNQDPYLSSIPVLVASAIAESPSPSGTQGFLRKPVDLKVMLKEIEGICGPAQKEERNNRGAYTEGLG